MEMLVKLDQSDIFSAASPTPKVQDSLKCASSLPGPFLGLKFSL